MYYLIGRTLGHSYSADIHGAFGLYGYGLKSLEPEELESFIRSGDWEGLNVTIPYKEAVMPFLDEISPEAARIGCVNTVVREGGRLVGYNTDYMGFLGLADRAGIDFSGGKVVILGTGATSKTVETAARDRGAASVIHASRKGEPGTVSYDSLGRDADCDILINATPVGMYPNIRGTLADLSGFTKLRGVLDVIYNPFRTGLVLQAARLGIPARSGGLYMLVRQAAEAARLWTGKMPSNCDEIYKKLAISRANILLEGMPGCGKSSVARELGRITGRPVVDTDAEIEKEYGMTIPEVFERFGEARFRDTETEVLERVCREGGQIISVGGGAPAFPRNYDIIGCNSRVYLILRDIDKLSRRGRPLSKGADLEEMWQRRRVHYRSVADAEARNDRTAAELAAEIWEDYCENIGD